MAGRIDDSIASRLGTLLATIHAEAPGYPVLHGSLRDTSLFEELRVDPYYRTAARAHPDLSPRISALIDQMDRPASERTLVLGDFSPKNILVHAGGLILLDFECACGRPCVRSWLLPEPSLTQGDSHGLARSGESQGLSGTLP